LIFVPAVFALLHGGDKVSTEPETDVAGEHIIA